MYKHLYKIYFLIVLYFLVMNIKHTKKCIKYNTIFYFFTLFFFLKKYGSEIFSELHPRETLLKIFKNVKYAISLTKLQFRK